jgi:hypothetical protein
MSGHAAIALVLLKGSRTVQNLKYLQARRTPRAEEVLTRAVPEGASELEDLLLFAEDVNGSEDLGDDFSIIKMTI